VFARKIIRLFGHVTTEDIENEVRAVAALCSGRECKYIVEVLKHGWLTNAYTDYFIDMEYCPETLEDRIIQWRKESSRYRPPSTSDPAQPENEMVVDDCPLVTAKFVSAPGQAPGSDI
jgi:hypothetical protein